ncbi:LRR receptor serine/threonine-protein kinase [Salix suchowensis]|nr:LRR receptor serine/threonine-protein kinase [Salix suchowensis]
MIRNSGAFYSLGMSASRAFTFGAVLLLWLCCSSLLAAQKDGITDPVEVKALQDIRNSLIDINKNLSNWRRGDPCTSNWTGVLCFDEAKEDCYLHVRELQLLNMNLSGTLSPSLGNLTYMEILIPPAIGNIKSLKLLLLNGNQLTGSLPEELGHLPILDRIQIDQNHISGPIPKSFANLNKTKHFHMNNNSISGQIPAELSRLPNLVHFLLDNNNLSGTLPPELYKLPKLLILQLDNNHFDGSTIPSSYGNMTQLLKLSLRNCSLQGPMPDLSRIPNLGYLDLSFNQLAGPVPPNKLSKNITTIDLSNNALNGTIPDYFSELPLLQLLSIANNSLTGSVPSTIWQTRTNGNEGLNLHFENNQLSNINGSTSLPQNVTLWLQGNPACSNSSIVQFCSSQIVDVNNQSLTESNVTCPVQSCPPPFEYFQTPLISCVCSAPLIFGYRLKSPGFTNFIAYRVEFEKYLTSGLELNLYQLNLSSALWEEGPRLQMLLKLFPVYVNANSSRIFNDSEARRIISMFTGWNIPDSDVFGPYELLYITLLGPYTNVLSATPRKSKLSTAALVGIVVGAIAGAVTLSALVSLLILRKRAGNYRAITKRRRASKAFMKIEGVKYFSYAEMALATNNFNSSSQVGQGGYGRVYKGFLADGRVVAIKRAEESSFQGETEFLTEIELLSRVHHRNLVSLIGFCDENDEQMLVYEFMSNGTLRDHLSAKTKEPLSFATRMSIALASAKGILYLHTEADPPIFHRDVKASNILLDSRYNAKVADFGLSKLAPVPNIEGDVPGHISTVVKGTPGYLDPEYFLTHKLTDKSDVYSLGVVFLELLTGMQPISHGKNIVREVNIAYQTGMLFSLVDGRMGSYPSDCVDKFLTLAMKCCNDETDERPSMTDVVRELESIWNMMPESEITAMETVSTDHTEMEMASPSSFSLLKNPCVSSEVSGSDLVSGVVPAITPR